VREEYLLLEDVLLLDEVDAVEHALVVDGGEAGDDLQEQVVVRVAAGVVGGEDLEDVAVQVERVLQVRYLVLQLVVLLPQHLLHLKYHPASNTHTTTPLINTPHP
jgi:hypothetical protein